MPSIMGELLALQARMQILETQPRTKFKGTQAGDFTTTTLPHHGDYGFQSTANEFQMNCNGTIRAVGMATL